MKKQSREVLTVIMMMVLAMVMKGGSSAEAASFKECYAKCFIFCMIEPSQTLCSCSTSCLKDCIFPNSHNNNNKMNHLQEDQSRNYGFCKLGCAFSTCSAISSKGKPNVDKMDGCVGSCETMCTKSYSSP